MTIRQQLDRVYSPYWCQGDPLKLRWANGASISGVLGVVNSDLQTFPDVGLFNLLWLMVGDTDYSRPQTAAEGECMNNVIYTHQHEKLGPHRAGDAAAMWTLQQFYQALLVCEPTPSRMLMVTACVKKLGIKLEE